MDIKLGSLETYNEACCASRRAGLLLLAVFVLMLVSHDPLGAALSDRQDAAPWRHPNAGYQLEFGGLRG